MNYLNDFRWHLKIVAWGDLLLALKGDTVHLPTPKHLSSHEVKLQRGTYFLATSDAPIVFVKGGSIDYTNTQIANVKWRFFHLWRQIPVDEKQELVPCGQCFARFILENTANGVTTWVRHGLQILFTFLGHISHPSKQFFDSLLHVSSHFIVDFLLLSFFFISTLSSLSNASLNPQQSPGTLSIFHALAKSNFYCLS